MVNNIQSLPSVISKTYNEPVVPRDRNSETNNFWVNNSSAIVDQAVANSDFKSIFRKEKTEEKKPDYSKIADKLKSLVGEESVSFEITKDKETNKMIIKVIDNKTKEVLQQYPPEITLKIARMVARSMESGILTNEIV
jgi:uncharacterized FlaG/YvyC family protein